MNFTFSIVSKAFRNTYFPHNTVPTAASVQRVSVWLTSELNEKTDSV